MVRLVSLLMVMVLLVSSYGTAGAQGTSSSQTQIEKNRAKVRKIGIGERAKIRVHLLDGTTYEGYVREANEDNFVIVDKQGSPHIILYKDVKEVKSRRGRSTGAKIGTGIAIYAVAVLGVIGILMAIIDD